MKFGFTGTQNGMTEAQVNSFNKFVSKISEFHHGDCIGSDEQAHNLIRDFNPKIKIILHPPTNSSKRAYCKADEQRERKSYLERNKEIVNEIDYLIATPSGQEVLRSGTWSTIRYAKSQSKKIFIINPNGDIEKITTI